MIKTYSIIREILKKELAEDPNVKTIYVTRLKDVTEDSATYELELSYADRETETVKDHTINLTKFRSN